MLDNLATGTDDEIQELNEPDTDNSELVDDTDIDDVEEEEGEETETEELDEDADVVTLSQDEYKTLKDQQLMHANFTKKTMALAEERKAVAKTADDLGNMIDQLKGAIGDEEDSAELRELLEDGDTAEYLRRTEAIKSRKAMLKKAEKLRADQLVETQRQENQVLIDIMGDQWSDASKQKADIDAALAYAKANGWTDSELNAISSHRITKALIDAGRGEAIKSAKPEVKRKTRPTKKAAPTKKPVVKKQKSTAELFYGSK